MRILITGAAGFIGSHLATRLLNEGHDVVGIDNFSTGSAENLTHIAHHPNFRLIEHDVITPLNDLLLFEGRWDWIMHFACPASPPKYLARPLETMRVCSEGTWHLLEFARAHRAGFFLASTSEVYGDPNVHPQPESFWGNVNPIGPRSVYDEGKRFAEAMTCAYHRTHSIPVRIIRIFNTYGPRMDIKDGRVVTNFIGQALRGEPLSMYGDGMQTRSFQYVDDLIEGIHRLLSCEYYSPVNLGNPEEYTMRELAQLVQELTQAHSPLHFEPLPQDDPKQRKPDITLARSLLNWAPKIPVREGLLYTINYFRERLRSV